MADEYQKVAYIALRNLDGTYMLNVPLYIKVNEIGKAGVPAAQEDLIHKISEIMMRRYEKQLAECLARKNEEGGFQ